MRALAMSASPTSRDTDDERGGSLEGICNSARFAASEIGSKAQTENERRSRLDFEIPIDEQMGGGSSSTAVENEQLDGRLVSKRMLEVDALPENARWHDDKTFAADGTLIFDARKEYQELRNLLDEPLGQQYLGKFAQDEHTHEHFFAWVEMEEFRSIPTPDYRRCQACHIFQKYIKQDGVMHLGFLSPELVSTLQKQVYGEISELAAMSPSEARAARPTIEANLFVGVQHSIFREMVQNTFLRFKRSERYTAYREAKHKLYNRVHSSDFDYMSELGSGAYGKVIRVRKKSTGVPYAMKVISKGKMLAELEGKDSKVKYERLNVERNVYVHSRFPFIIDMDYAFQTEKFVILVMELALGGDLSKHLHSYPNERMPEDHARFVAAEVVMALSHLHFMNYVYRDLKPLNVLLDREGHVKLADMGLVARIDDEKGVKTDVDELDTGAIRAAKASSKKKRENKGTGEETPATNVEKPPTRRFTVLGTPGYKAPELLAASRRTKRGYGASVDWWALGVMMCKLLSGATPLESLARGGPLLGGLPAAPDAEENNVIDALKDKKASDLFPGAVQSELSDAAKAFCNGLLKHDPNTRIGSTNDSARNAQNHAFFERIDFDDLLSKKIPAPYSVKPTRLRADEIPAWKSFDDCLANFVDVQEQIAEYLGGESVDATTVSDRHQRYFKHWDYVSPSTKKMELGLQRMRTDGKLDAACDLVETDGKTTKEILSAISTKLNESDEA